MPDLHKHARAGARRVLPDRLSPFSWVDVTSHYNFTYDNNNRDLIVTAKDNLFGGDDVAVNMRVTPYSRLICKKSVLTTTSDVPVSSFTYSVGP
jgi:hypothetical protein